MPSAEQPYRCATPEAARAWLDDQGRRWLERSRRDGERAADQRHPCATLHYAPTEARGTPLLLLGGMGPLAGLEGFAQAHARDPQREIVLYQACDLPCRTRAIEAEAQGDNSVAAALVHGLGAAIEELLPAGRNGAELVVLCNTAHHYLPRLRERLPAAVRLHPLPRAAIAATVRRAPRRLMILTTEGGRLCGLYARAAHAAGLRWHEPDAEEHRLLQEAIMRGVKGGDAQALFTAGEALVRRLQARPEPPDALLAGCTEIPLLFAALRERGGEIGRYVARTTLIDPLAETLDSLPRR